MRLFPMAIQQLKFLIIGIDYFIKWVEMEPLATITKNNVRNFILKSIICCFRIPKIFISDNGKQFVNDAFKDFYQHLGIKNYYSSPPHPQVNGQVEVTNRSLLKIIKSQLKGVKGIWPDELQSMLCAYWMTACTPTGETPFHLAFGSEVVILAKVGLTSYRVAHHDERRNKEGMRWQLDILDEVRATAEQRITHYQHLMAKHYNTKVRPWRLEIGDLVLRKVTSNAKDPT